MANATDALTDILKTIRLNAHTYFCSDFAAPWGMEIPHSPEGLFHIVVEGQCWLQQGQDSLPLLLRAGDIVAFPTGGAHWISDSLGGDKLPGPEVVSRILDGSNPFAPADEQQPAQTTLLCGSFSYDTTIKHPFLRDLPCFILISARETPELAWLRNLVTVLADEARTPTPGSQVMTDRLTEVLFIQLMRTNMHANGGQHGYLAALADPQIGAALNLIHAEEHAQWTVERLGDAVALSRSAFTERFARMVGMPPKNYLVNWRMQKARDRLTDSKSPMIDVAETAGYSSEAAFSKAFKQFYGITPGKLRRNPSTA